MMMNEQRLSFVSPEAGVEAARADMYGLLANLFYAPPDAAMLARIVAVQADPAGGVLDSAWLQLAAAAAQSDVAVLAAEYEQLFIGTGKPEILLYGSYYLSGFLMEKPLAALRTDLHALGLERAEQMPETEDHLAYLCEVMRYLITSEDATHSALALQRRFYATQLQSWAARLCSAISEHPRAQFYVAVASLAAAFFDVETVSFDME